MPITEDVNLDQLASTTEGFSGADIGNVCRRAVLAAIRENLEASKVSMKHFRDALATVQPSISQDILNQFAQFAERFLGQ